MSRPATLRDNRTLSQSGLDRLLEVLFRDIDHQFTSKVRLLATDTQTFGFWQQRSLAA